jgi:hypothetical protein
MKTNLNSIRHKIHWPLFTSLVLVTSLLPFVSSAEAAGPWTGQVVDKETATPLEGAVVLAVWRKCGFIVMDGCAEYYDAEEVVTGPDGRFVIQPRRWLGIFPPFSPLKGPDLYIFKPSYGQWEFQSGSDEEGRKNLENKEGAVLVLPKLKTRQERMAFLTEPGLEIPKEKMKNYLLALDRERINLGLEPGYSK